MSQANLGSFSGSVTPGVNMLEVFRQKEREENPNSILNFGRMSLKMLSMSCPAGTEIKVNGKKITLFSGVFELSMDRINITSLEFLDAVEANIYYMF